MKENICEIFWCIGLVFFWLGLDVEKEWALASDKKYWIGAWEGFKQNAKDEFTIIPIRISWLAFRVFMYVTDKISKILL